MEETTAGGGGAGTPGELLMKVWDMGSVNGFSSESNSEDRVSDGRDLQPPDSAMTPLGQTQGFVWN